MPLLNLSSMLAISLHLYCLCPVFFITSTPQEGGLSLLLSLAQPPTAAVDGTAASEDAVVVATSGTGDWDVFASAVKLLRRACMLSANRSDLLSLKVLCV